MSKDELQSQLLRIARSFRKSDKDELDARGIDLDIAIAFYKDGLGREEDNMRYVTKLFNISNTLRNISPSERMEEFKAAYETAPDNELQEFAKAMILFQATQAMATASGGSSRIDDGPVDVEQAVAWTKLSAELGISDKILDEGKYMNLFQVQSQGREPRRGTLAEFAERYNIEQCKDILQLGAVEHSSPRREVVSHVERLDSSRSRSSSPGRGGGGGGGVG